MNGKYFTLLTLCLALSFSLGAQRSITNVTRGGDKCVVTPAQKSDAGISKSHLVKVETKANQAKRGVKKYALAEEFTNASCPPCAAQNPAYNTLLNNNEGSVIAVKYQVWFPGYDPMYETNTVEVQERWSVYEAYTNDLYGSDGMGGVPTAYIDGYMGHGSYGGGNWSQAYFGAPAGYNQNTMNYASSVVSPLDIEVTHSYNEAVDSVNISVSVINNADSAFSINNYRLHTYLLEAQLNWPSAPGTNGEKDFSHVFRKAASDVNGDDVLPASLDAGASVTYTYSVALEDYVFILSQLEAVAFIQNAGDLTVMNAGISTPVPFPNGAVIGDPGITNISKASSALCPESYTAEPIIRVTNNNSDDSDITQVTAAYSLNGTEVVQEFTTDIKGGASQNLSFGSISVPGGNNIISVRLISFNNGAKDGNAINNITEDFGFTYLSESGSPAPVAYDMEGSGDLASTLFLADPTFPVIYTLTPNATNPPANRGAYAQSANSIMFFFYQWNPADLSASMTITSDKINLPSKPIYSYDWAYTGYTEGGTTYDADKLEFYYSTDCGATFTKFKTLSGAAFKTANNQANVFLPSASQWKSDTVKLSESLANAEDVIFQIKATSDWGNNAYIDNIFVGQDPAISGVNKINSFDNVSVYPNPTSDQLNIRINAKNPTNASLTILDYTGKVVRTLNNNQVINNGSNNMSFDVSTLTNGMYLIKIENKEGVNIYPVSVLK